MPIRRNRGVSRRRTECSLGPWPSTAWIFSDFDPPTTWLPPLIRVLDTVGVLSADNQPVADGNLIASFLGTYRHRVTLLDLKAYRHLPREVVIERLQLVLVLEAPGAFARIRQTLQTILGHYGRPENRRQTLIRLPGRRIGVRYRDRTWPPWQSFEWTAAAQRFYFAIGQGTLAEWFEADRPGDADPRLATHPAQINSAAAASDSWKCLPTLTLCAVS